MPITTLWLLDVFIQACVGSFFCISGYHKLFNAQRHASLVETLKANHIPFVTFNQWWVPFVEFSAGLVLVLNLPFGLVPLASLGLLVICLVACITDGRKRVASYSPIDKADVIDDWLYLPEVIYAILLVEIALTSIMGV